MADTGKLIFTDPRLAIENEISKMYSNGVNFVIALGSAGYDGAQTLLSTTFNVDLFINGGGSNAFLYNGKRAIYVCCSIVDQSNLILGIGPLDEKVKGPYPTVVNNQGTQRLLVQTSRYGKYLGQVELNINDEGRIVSFNAPNPILLDKNVGQGMNF